MGDAVSPPQPVDRLTMLLEDASLVADTVVRMGRMDDSSLLDDIETARAALASGSAASKEIVNLQKSLNKTIKDLSPITLNDIKRNPDWSKGKDSLGLPAVLVLIFGLLVLSVTGVLSESYSRGIASFKNLVEFQSNNNSQEDIVKLASLLSSSREGMIDAVAEKDSRTSELLGLTLSNIQLKQLRYLTLLKTSSEIEAELNVFCYYLNFSCPPIQPINQEIDSRIKGQKESKSATYTLSLIDRVHYFLFSDLPAPPDPAKLTQQMKSNQQMAVKTSASQQESLNFYDQKSAQNFANDSKDSSRCSFKLRNGTCFDDELRKLKNLKEDELRAELRKKDLYTILEIILYDYDKLGTSTRIGFRPLNPPDFSYQIYDLKKQLIKVGFWYLPFLYGMLGALVFQVRRALDPMSSTPTGIQMFFRIFLGGFIGLIVIWILNPSPDNVVIPDFASFGVFALAFVFGFGTEIFFLTVDKLVTKAAGVLAG